MNKQMREPTFDKDGYPVEETLETIQTWELMHGDSRAQWEASARELMEFLNKAWRYEDHVKETAPGLWVLCCRGWSGNESLLSALRENMWFHALESLELGYGFAVIAITPEAGELLEAKRMELVHWAWNPIIEEASDDKAA